jgi:hypothetical protein
MGYLISFEYPDITMYVILVVSINDTKNANLSKFENVKMQNPDFILNTDSRFKNLNSGF